MCVVVFSLVDDIEMVIKASFCACFLRLERFCGRLQVTFFP